MKQYEAVIQTLEKLGGQATLGQLYVEVLTIKECEWATKTPYASIRRIVQTRSEIFKVRPGLWALRAYKSRLGLVEDDQKTAGDLEQNHSYFQGLLITIGNLRGFGTFIPNQDKNKNFLRKPLGEMRSLQIIPQFSHDSLVKRCQTVDAIWFNNRLMPDSLFEVEHSTDIQNSLLKFFDLRDLNTRMIIVSHESRKREFDQKLRHTAFEEIQKRVNFLGYDSLVKQYEVELLKANQSFLV